MSSTIVLPHVNVLMKALKITISRLDGKTKLPVEASALKFLLLEFIRQLPFDAELYQQLNPDVANSVRDGHIEDVHEHYINNGFFEGRIATWPKVDEDYYLRMYPDVVDAIEKRQVASAKDHYNRAGFKEGRFPSIDMEKSLKRWTELAAGQDN